MLKKQNRIDNKLLKEIKDLEEKIKECRLCNLSQTRTNAVPGSGNYQAKLMIIGEAPGRNEDLQGLPFVGQAGKLLEQMLNEINLKREDVFITNVVKCRPPENRDPTEEEIKICSPYLFKQIELINPKVILLLGKYSLKTILNINLKISYLKGRIFIKNNKYIFCTYHPAFILRNPSYIEEYRYHFNLLKSILEKTD
ncbi:MAG: uracil-DNA glycosylase [bacterium]